MTNLVKKGNSLIVTCDNDFPFEEGKISIPFSSVFYVVDVSDLVVFKSVSNGDILFQGMLGEMTIDGTVVTRDNIVSKFDEFNKSGGGGVIGDESDPIWNAEKENYYTKSEADGLFQPVGDYAQASDVENKQDLLVSGVNIKTINGEDILGEGDIEVKGGGVVISLTQEEYDALETKDPQTIYNITDSGDIDVYTKAETYSKAEIDSKLGDINTLLETIIGG